MSALRELRDRIAERDQQLAVKIEQAKRIVVGDYGAAIAYIDRAMLAQHRDTLALIDALIKEEDDNAN